MTTAHLRPSLGRVSGRLFDEQGQCNTTKKPLSGVVHVIRPGEQWAVVFQLADSRAHVAVLVDRRDLCSHGQDDAVPLFATGLLYGDEASEYQRDAQGHPIFDVQREAVRRAPVVTCGAFEGARVLLAAAAGQAALLRVDCAALLPFYLECPLFLTQQ